ncbi:MAG TPA: FtsX-like permease family protein [Firmicutes bacterium]|nr:FtsX-like permease family protein [Bacillota bacterium]
MRIIIKFVLKNIQEKKLRTLLVLFSIMLSSALYFATESLSETAKEMFIERMTVYFGSADLLIYPTKQSPSNFLTPRPAEHLAEDFKYIVGVIEANGNLLLSNETLRLRVKGFDLADLQKMNPYYLAAQENLLPFYGKKVIISKTIAEKYGFKLGDYLDIEVFGAKRRFLLSALAEPSGPFQDDGQFATVITPIDTLASILRARGKATTLYLKVKDPQRKEEIIQKLHEAYPRYRVRETFTEEELVEYTRSLTVTFQLMGAVVLLMSIYIIYSTFKVITRERLPIIGTFRSIGATKTLTSLILIAESLMYGLIGGFFGCVSGIGVLYLITIKIRPDFMRSVPVTLSYPPTNLASALTLAVFLSVTSSIIPIIKVSGIPVKNLILNIRKNRSRQKRWKPVLGLTFVLLGLLFPWFTPFHLLLPVAMVCLTMCICGFTLLTPTLTAICLRGMTGVYLHLFGNIGILAAKNLRENKGVLNNITLLALGLSSLLMINTVSYSVAREVTNFYKDGKFQIFFWASQTDRNIEAILRRIDGVEDTYGLYTATHLEVTNLRERINLLHGVNKDKYLNYWDLDLDQILLEELDTGRHILITNSLRERLGVKKGDLLTLKLNRGERRYRIIGFFDSLMWNGNFALIAERYLKLDMNLRYYNELYIKTSKDPVLVVEKIKHRMARRDPWLTTMDQMTEDNLRSNEKIFTVMQAFSLMALVIGTFGVFNNLLISFLERRRPLAVLRSIGMSKAQSITMFFLESLTGGLIGGGIGLLSGYCLLRIVPLVIKALATDIPIHHSLSLFLSSLLAGVLINIIATTGPALKSSKLSIVEAIKYE